MAGDITTRVQFIDPSLKVSLLQFQVRMIRDMGLELLLSWVFL